MTRHIFAASCLILAIAAAGCDDGEKPGSGDSEGGAESQVQKDSPAVVEAKGVVRRLLDAAKKGDLGAFKSLYGHDIQIDPEQIAPRNFTFEVRDGWLKGDTAAFVEAYEMYPDIRDGKNEFIVTYELRRIDGGWKVIGAKPPRAAWNEND